MELTTVLLYIWHWKVSIRTCMCVFVKILCTVCALLYPTFPSISSPRSSLSLFFLSFYTLPLPPPSSSSPPSPPLPTYVSPRNDLELQFKCYHGNDKLMLCQWPQGVTVNIDGRPLPIDRVRNSDMALALLYDCGS